MRTLRDVVVGTACVAALVVCCSWYARHPGGAWPWDTPGPVGDSEPVAVDRVEWSADGHRLLALLRGDVGPDGPLVVHDSNGDRTPVAVDFALPDEEFGECAALAPDGLHVACGTGRGRLLWTAVGSNESKCLLDVPGSSRVVAVAISPEGNLVAAALLDGRILLCDPQVDRPHSVLSGPAGKVTDLRFSSDGRRLLAAATNGSVAVWDAAERKLESRWIAHAVPAMAAALLPDGRKIITAGWDGTVRLWDLGETRELWSGQFECFGPATLDVTPDGKTAAWSGSDRKLIIWNVESGQREFEIDCPSPIMQVRFAPDGNTLAVAGKERLIRIYDARTGVELPGIETGNPHSDLETTR